QAAEGEARVGQPSAYAATSIVAVNPAVLHLRPVEDCAHAECARRYQSRSGRSSGLASEDRDSWRAPGSGSPGIEPSGGSDATRWGCTRDADRARERAAHRSVCCSVGITFGGKGRVGTGGGASSKVVIPERSPNCAAEDGVSFARPDPGIQSQPACPT